MEKQSKIHKDLLIEEDMSASKLLEGRIMGSKIMLRNEKKKYH